MQLLISRGNPNGIIKFSASMFSWGSAFFTQSPAALHLLDGAIRRWGRHVLAGLPAHPVLVYIANLNGLTLNTWRWDDSSPSWDAPFPWPGVLDAHSPPLSSVWRLNHQGRGPTMHLPCVPILSMPGSGASPVGVMTPSLVEALQDIVVSLKVADSVMPL